MPIRPFSVLPNEVLLVIFRNGPSPTERRAGLPFEMSVASVSRRFRQLAIAEAGLWTVIDFLPWKYTKLLDLYLERSRAQRLSIHFDCAVDFDNRRPSDYPHTDPQFPTLRDHPQAMDRIPKNIDILLRHTERWWHLVIVTATVGPLDLIYSHVNAQFFPILERLCIHMSTPIPWFTPSVFANSTAPLTSLMLNGVWPFSHGLPLASLTEITLYNNRLPFLPQYDDFCDMLASAPMLVQLALYGNAFHPRVWNARRDPIVLAYLECLDVRPDARPMWPGEDYLSELFMVLEAPALSCLILVTPDASQVQRDRFSEYLKNPVRHPMFPSLRCLHLFGVAGFFDIGVEWINAFPSVNCIHLVGPNETTRIPKILLDGGPDLWPDLRKVVLPFGAENWALIVALLRTRKKIVELQCPRELTLEEPAERLRACGVQLVVRGDGVHATLDDE